MTVTLHHGDLILPTAKKYYVYGSFTKSVMADLGQVYGGRAAVPTKPIEFVDRTGTRILLVGGPGVEVAELEEMGLEQQEKNEKRLRERGSIIDFAGIRERRGLPAAKDFDQLFRQALADRVAQHKKNPVADPARVPLRWFG